MEVHRSLFRGALPLSVAVCLAAALCTASCASSRKVESGADARNAQAARKEATLRELQDTIDRQASLLADQDARIEQLEGWLFSQQRMLNEAMQEVVQVQAQQRSMKSRAEAASELAEAEIALQSLRDKAAGTDRPEPANADQLLTRGTAEFDRQNFGGALYLVGQAKSQIKLGELRLGESQRAEAAEMPYVVPLSLTLDRRGNLREGPGQEFRVLATLEPGARINAYFTRGAWMRVEDGDGHSGWIHRSLLSSN